MSSPHLETQNSLHSKAVRDSNTSRYRSDVKPLNVMTSPFFLVYPPVSNQEAEWVTNDREVEKLLRTSDLYMIAMRAEATFTLPPTQEGSVMRIEITTGDTLTDVVELDIEVLAANTFGVDNIPDDLEIRLGPKIIKLFADATEDDIDSERVTPFEWFSTEKLIYDFGRRKPGISGFRRHRDFATYRLLYVGIARKTDTFARQPGRLPQQSKRRLGRALQGRDCRR